MSKPSKLEVSYEESIGGHLSDMVMSVVQAYVDSSRCEYLFVVSLVEIIQMYKMRKQ